MQPLLNIAIQAARTAGDIILRHTEQLDRLKISEKGKHDFFTEVDLKAEQAIIQTIHKAYPMHGILAEESGLQQTPSEYVWIIDPLDGTRNYIHGFPFYAVSIAITIKDKIEHAVIYDPMRHECFAASRGRGARLNDYRIRVSKQTQLDAAMLAISLRDIPHALRQQTQSILDTCANTRRTGSAALDLAYVAAGRLDGSIGLGLKPWDIAAGSLLVQEAGGFISDDLGQDTFLTRGHILTGTPKVYRQMMQFFE